MDRLDNDVRTYTWGSLTAIPALLGVPPTGEPQAEMWMGAHPGSPSRIDRGHGPRSLADVIAADPVRELGPATAARFGPRLPFLFKVLAAEQPLSLQVHPDAEQARAGFADEQARGIPIDAPWRNYRDASHKPELLCALGDFDALCGFREISETVRLLDILDVRSLDPCAEALRGRGGEAGLRTATTHVFTMPLDARKDVVDDVAAACRRLAATASPFARTAAAVADLADRYPGDPGVVATLLLNHIRLSRGEAIYLDAGLPHSYLNGVAVELLANSDNVLRSGLTDKHIDVPELLRVLRFRAGPVEILRPYPADCGEEVYHTPVEDFRLSLLRPSAAGPCRLGTETPQILLCVEGAVVVAETGGDSLTLDRGGSLYLRAGGPPAVVTGDGEVFRATLPPPMPG
jgi:mannose-6-phosphate isomerase